MTKAVWIAVLLATGVVLRVQVVGRFLFDSEGLNLGTYFRRNGSLVHETNIWRHFFEGMIPVLLSVRSSENERAFLGNDSALGLGFLDLGPYFRRHFLERVEDLAVSGRRIDEGHVFERP
jgi:hypothetical protein